MFVFILRAVDIYIYIYIYINHGIDSTKDNIYINHGIDSTKDNIYIYIYKSWY